MQIEAIEPDIIYFTDPIMFDSKFIRSLKKRPSIVLGWRAANIPENTDWSEFDCILSGLQGVREAAIRMGAKRAFHFLPAFPEWIMREIVRSKPSVDVVFSGQYTSTQHKSRNMLLHCISMAALEPSQPFSAAFFLSGQPELAPVTMRRHVKPPVYGLEMHTALRNGRIAFDARGNIEMKCPESRQTCDIACKETANMRILEATGTGVFS